MKIIGIFQLFFQSFKKPAAKGKKGGAAERQKWLNNVPFYL